MRAPFGSPAEYSKYPRDFLNMNCLQNDVKAVELATGGRPKTRHGGRITGSFICSLNV